MAEQSEHKGIALVILGIVAIIAIVGLVLLFTGANKATGQGMYGGEIKGLQFPNWYGRGVPRGGISDSSTTYEPAATTSNDMHSNWNFYGNPDRNPIGDVPSPLTSCGQGGLLIAVNQDLVMYYQQRGYTIVPTGGSKPGLCVYPPETMVGGIAGGGYGKAYGYS